MNYPLSLSFKIVALAPQIFVRDANGTELCYVKQKMFKLREAVKVFTNQQQDTVLCDIKANKIIDWSATYNFVDQAGNEFGAVRRKGMRSLWKAHYQVVDGQDLRFEINEENGWVKVLDGVLGQIPLIGAFTGYFFNPSYIATRPGDETPVMRVAKQPAFWEGKFTIEKIGDLDEQEELALLMAFLMMLLLERSRG
jgi:hypothetical protein